MIPPNPNDSLSFEKAFARLEQILEKMNGGTLSLEDSLQLYEEADSLIRLCNTRLTAAETKIEMLVKNREGELALTESGAPIKEPFAMTKQSSEQYSSGVI
jgi:exodeoxyribonuclease VII small subunit